MNYYEPKFLRAVIEKTLPLRLFFRTRFFSEQVTFPTRQVSFEFMKNSRRLMPYARAGKLSVPVSSKGYSLRTYEPPLVSGYKSITEATLEQKLFGEEEWNSGMTPAEREQKLIARYLMELQDMIYRKEEYMCSRIKQDGKLIINENDYAAEVDYGFSNIYTLKTADQWKTDADILGQLKDKANSLRQDGVNPDMLILGAKASQAFLNNAGILKLRRDLLLDVHAPMPNELENGLNYLCQIRAPGLFLNCYEYLEYYRDDATGQALPLIDESTAILQSSQEQNMMLYGAITYIDDNENRVTAMNEYVPYVLTIKESAERRLIVSSKPLPLPADIDSWCVLKNVI